MKIQSILRVVVIEDSPLVREVIVQVCEELRGIRVVAQAEDGPGGVRAVRDHRPDLVLLDLGLPGFDGFEVISRVMAETPTPIVVVTATLRPPGRPEAFHALGLGAVHVMEKPTKDEWSSPSWREEFRRELRFLAKAPIIKHMAKRERPAAARETGRPEREARQGSEVVVIAGSAGGAQASRDLLAALPAISVPVLLALHLGPSLHEPFARFLEDSARRNVAIAVPDRPLEPGMVYVAPGRRHIEFVAKGRVRVFDHLEGRNYVPSLDHLMASTARVYGPSASGVILTGLGSDGATGLLAIRQAGGRTLGQTEETCVVSGMPRAAVELGAVERCLAPEELGHAIGRWFPT